MTDGAIKPRLFTTTRPYCNRVGEEEGIQQFMQEKKSSYFASAEDGHRTGCEAMMHQMGREPQESGVDPHDADKSALGLLVVTWTALAMNSDPSRPH